MASKYQKKAERQDSKAIARPQRNYQNSAPENGESTQPKPKSKPKFEPIFRTLKCHNSLSENDNQSR